MNHLHNRDAFCTRRGAARYRHHYLHVCEQRQLDSYAVQFTRSVSYCAVLITVLTDNEYRTDDWECSWMYTRCLLSQKH